MKTKMFLALALLSFHSGPIFCEPDNVKEMVTRYFNSGAVNSSEGQRLILRNPDIVEGLLLSNQSNFFVRHNSFVYFLRCCYERVITTDKFMDVAFTLMMKVNNKDLLDLDSLDTIIYANAISCFGYDAAIRKSWLSIQENMNAFKHCLDKMLEHGFLHSTRLSDALKDKISLCQDILNEKNASRKNRAMDVLKSAEILIQNQVTDRSSLEAKKIIPAFLKNLISQIRDTYE
ncbi:MAG: hypothetical protein AB1744_01545 [Candidatus Zixiibacteriota bacterium]